MDWCDWELSLVSVEPDAVRDPKYTDPAVRMAFARLVTHYFRKLAWLEDGILLREAHKLAGIPGVMVHGQIDFGAPLVTAWELAKAWPDGELVVVRRAGHSARDPGMQEAVLAATERFEEGG